VSNGLTEPADPDGQESWSVSAVAAEHVVASS
jgi:hypothetical protein